VLRSVHSIVPSEDMFYPQNLIHLHMPVHYVPVSLIINTFHTSHTWHFTGKYTRTITHVIWIALHPSQAPRSLFGSKCAVKYLYSFPPDYVKLMAVITLPYTHTHTLGLLIAQNIINNLHIISFVLIIFVWQSV